MTLCQVLTWPNLSELDSHFFLNCLWDLLILQVLLGRFAASHPLPDFNSLKGLSGDRVNCAFHVLSITLVLIHPERSLNTSHTRYFIKS
jgi:hypothetical protein